MRRIALLFLAFLFSCNHAYAQVLPTGVLVSCNKTAYYDASTNGATQLVPVVTGAKIYVCGFDFYAGGTGNVSLEYGTGTNCGTGTVVMTPAFQLKAQTGLVDRADYWMGLNTIASQELCINSSAGVAVQGIVYYAQFGGGP
jgi:hypothetical protein